MGVSSANSRMIRFGWMALALFWVSCASVAKPTMLVMPGAEIPQMRGLPGTIVATLGSQRWRGNFAITDGRVLQRSELSLSKNSAPLRVHQVTLRDQKIQLIGPTARSLDDRFAAVAFIYAGESPVAYNVAIVDTATSVPVAVTRRPQERKILDLAWAPNGEFMVVLSNRWAFGLWPWDLLAMLTGHPTEKGDLFLEIFDSHLNSLYDVPVAADVENAGGGVNWLQ